MIHSWDLFDTLIGRKCGTAIRLHAEMGKILGIWDFVQRRLASELLLQEKKVAYTLKDIYENYSISYGDSFRNLAELEWELELKNVYSIKRNVNKLRPEDIVISDMYLDEDELRMLMIKAGIRFSGKILVSNYGKHYGTVWPDLKGNIISHCGDNQYSDIRMPAKYGIRARDARTRVSSLEEHYGKHSEDLKWWVHYHRLRNISDENMERLDMTQIQLNVPLLWTACNLLKIFVDRRNIRELLFMSRDGQMFQKMWEILYPDIPSQYLYISRECLRGDSKTYFNYLNSIYTENTCLVDMAASGGSLKIALPKLVNPHPKIWTLVFLPGFKIDLTGIDLTYATTNIETRINNTWLEMLNYADHWHIADVVGKPIYDQFDEYNMDYVLGYHRLFEEMLQDVPRTKVQDPERLLRRILPAIHEEGPFLRRLFPEHLSFETNRKKKFKEYL